MNNFNSIPDKDLILNYQNGCFDSFNTLLNRHKQLIFGSIYNKVKNSKVAEDIFQETFYKVLICINEGKYSENGKFIHWVLRISHNMIIDYFRDSKKMTLVYQSDCEDEDNNVSVFKKLESDFKDYIDQSNDKYIEIKLKQIINSLPKLQKEIVELRLYKGMSFKDISRHYDVSINTVLGRMRYAVLNIRKILETQNIELC